MTERVVNTARRSTGVIEGRTALYRGFMVIMHPYPKRGMTAYRSLVYYNSGTSSYEAAPGEDIATIIDDANDHGELTEEQFEELAGASANLPEIDLCIGCGQEHPAEEMYYEGVEPIVFDPRCHICMVKQAQDVMGPENVILPEGWRN